MVLAPLRAAGSVCLLATFAASLWAQTPDADAHRRRVQALERNNWIETDTVITFDPETMKEDMQVIANNQAPFQLENGQTVYRLAEQMPEFPGGKAALDYWIAGNKKTPAPDPTEQRSQGNVRLRFIVNADGTINPDRIEVVSSTLSERYQKAARALPALMPRWTPARHKGRAVACVAAMEVLF